MKSEKRKYAGYYFHMGLLIWACITVFQIFNFLVARRDFQLPPPQLWLDNMLAKCGLVFNEHKMFVVSAFVKMGVISAPFGAYFGLLVDAVYFGGTRERINTGGSLFLALLRFLTISVLVLPITLPFFYISSANHVWFLYLFKISVPFFLPPFVMFAFARPIFEKLGIQSENVENQSARGGSGYASIGSKYF